MGLSPENCSQVSARKPVLIAQRSQTPEEALCVMAKGEPSQPSPGGMMVGSMATYAHSYHYMALQYVKTGTYTLDESEKHPLVIRQKNTHGLIPLMERNIQNGQC